MSPDPPADSSHRELMRAAVAHEAEAQRAALTGRVADSEPAFREAAEAYRRSWELAPPGSYGRLVGMLKASILGGSGPEAGRYVEHELTDAGAESPTAAYAAALAALALGEDQRATAHTEVMRGGSEAFVRTADAIEALANGDRTRYRGALEAIVADFEGREAHLTGVAMADTAAMLERLAAARGMSTGVQSPLLPPKPRT